MVERIVILEFGVEVIVDEDREREDAGDEEERREETSDA